MPTHDPEPAGFYHALFASSFSVVPTTKTDMADWPGLHYC